MRAVVQRVTEAEVVVGGSSVGQIGHGLLVLLGVGRGDTRTEVEWMAKKLSTLRIFADESGKFDRSLIDVGGGMLVVSQFTLFGDAKKGNRPSFTNAADPELAEPLYEAFCAEVSSLGIPVETGVFAASMDVRLRNDGPVTLVIDRDPTGEHGADPRSENVGAAVSK